MPDIRRRASGIDPKTVFEAPDMARCPNRTAPGSGSSAPGDSKVVRRPSDAGSTRGLSMIAFLLSRLLHPARRSFLAMRRGWRWETIPFDRPRHLTNGRMSRDDGGQMWRRWNGRDYDWVQLAMMP
jgi:hypothetical protein